MILQSQTNVPQNLPEKRFKSEVLSRMLEDSGNITSVLILRNTCGAIQSKVLGVDTCPFAPYAFIISIISPFMTILFGFLNIKIRWYAKGKKPGEEITE